MDDKADAMRRGSVFLVVAVVIAAPASATTMTGPVSVIDGDTLDMTGTRIRLVGIDAPEARQSCSRGGEAWACGDDAADNLRAIIADKSVTCAMQGTDTSGRIMAVCHTSTLDIGREMVRRGLALALEEAAPDYHDAQSLARKLGFGLWGASFQTPREWRAAQGAEAPAAAPRSQRSRRAGTPTKHAAAASHGSDPSGCVIKGNRNARGEWIYHLPGQAYYHQTRPEELFCSESAAIAAGYRRSKV